MRCRLCTVVALSLVGGCDAATQGAPHDEAASVAFADGALRPGAEIARISAGTFGLKLDEQTPLWMFDRDRVYTYREGTFFVVRPTTGEVWSIFNPHRAPDWHLRSGSWPVYAVSGSRIHFLTETGVVSYDTDRPMTQAAVAEGQDFPAPLDDWAFALVSEDGDLYRRELPQGRDFVGRTRGGWAVQGERGGVTFEVLEANQIVSRGVSRWPIEQIMLDADKRVWVSVQALTSADVDGERKHDGLIAYSVFDRTGRFLFNFEGPQVWDASGNRALLIESLTEYRIVVI